MSGKSRVPAVGIDPMVRLRAFGSRARVSVRSSDRSWSEAITLPAEELWLSRECADAALDLLEETLVEAIGHAGEGHPALLVIPPADTAGYGIEVLADGRETQAWFGGLTQVFASPQQAMAWVRRAVLDQLVLEIETGGGSIVHTLGRAEGGDNAFMLRSGSRHGPAGPGSVEARRNDFLSRSRLASPPACIRLAQAG